MKKTLFITLTALLFTACNYRRTDHFYYPNGKLQIEVEMKGKQMDGLFVSYFENGNKEQEFFYKENVANGAYRKYHYNGRLSESGTYIDGMLEGVYQYFNENEFLIKEVNYVHNQLNGSFTEFYPAGNVKILGSYKEGEFDGLWSYWEIDGRKIGVAHFEMGTGTYINYHPNGAIAVECSYFASKRHGSEKFYTRNGQLYQENIYENDVLVNEKYFSID